MNKRGGAETLELSTMAEVLFGIVVATSLIMMALSWNSLSNFNKIYLEEDLMLQSNAVFSTPGRVQVIYPISSDYKIEMKDTVKIVHSPSFFGGEETDFILAAEAKTEGFTKIGRSS